MFDSLNRNIHMTLVAKAPCRVDLAGGTIDIWPLYLFHAGAVTLLLVERGAKQRVAGVLAAQGAAVLPVCVAPQGVQVRTD